MTGAEYVPIMQFEAAPHAYPLHQPDALARA
jgi:hypothetical protein